MVARAVLLIFLAGFFVTPEPAVAEAPGIAGDSGAPEEPQPRAGALYAAAAALGVVGAVLRRSG